jgi:hypothetical protein
VKSLAKLTIKEILKQLIKKLHEAMSVEQTKSEGSGLIEKSLQPSLLRQKMKGAERLL